MSIKMNEDERQRLEKFEKIIIKLAPHNIVLDIDNLQALNIPGVPLLDRDTGKTMVQSLITWQTLSEDKIIEYILEWKKKCTTQE